MADPFLGEIRIFGFNFAPRYWAMCNGQLVPIAQNTSLYSILGTTYGGDGRQTLGLPWFKDGRAPLHVGGSSGAAPGLRPGPHPRLCMNALVMKDLRKCVLIITIAKT